MEGVIQMDCFEVMPIELREDLAKTTWNYLNGDLDEISANKQYQLIKHKASLISYIQEKMDSDYFCNIEADKRKMLWGNVVGKLQILQDLESPLKKGGTKVFFKPNMLLACCSTILDDEAEIVFDTALGIISSFPDDNSYTLGISDFSDFNYEDCEIKRIMLLGTIDLKDRMFSFEFRDKNGVEYHDSLLMFSEIDYKHGEIAFRPSMFMKALAISATIIPGAYGTQSILAQLQNKYDRRLYWFLASKKNQAEWSDFYKSNIIKCTVRELGDYLYINPELHNYRYLKDIFLESAKRNMERIEEMPFRFEFNPLAEGISAEEAIVTCKIREYKKW